MKPSIYNFEPRHSGKLIPARLIICFVLGFIAVYGLGYLICCVLWNYFEIKSQ